MAPTEFDKYIRERNQARSEAARRVAQKYFGDAHRPENIRTPRVFAAITEDGTDADAFSGPPLAEDEEEITEEQFYALRASSNIPPSSEYDDEDVNTSLADLFANPK